MSRKGMTPEQDKWMEAALLKYTVENRVIYLEEHVQPCYHVMVLPDLTLEQVLGILKWTMTKILDQTTTTPRKDGAPMSEYTEEQYEMDKEERRSMTVHPTTINPEYDFENIKSAKAFAEADGKGCVVVLPKSNELFIDIDDAEGAMAYSRNIGKFQDHVSIVVDETCRPSKSGEEGCYHYTLSLDRDITAAERILFQLMLGSDRTRETLSYIRLVNSDPNPTLFFEKKPKQLTAGVTHDEALEKLHEESQEVNAFGEPFPYEYIYTYTKE